MHDEQPAPSPTSESQVELEIGRLFAVYVDAVKQEVSKQHHDDPEFSSKWISIAVPALRVRFDRIVTAAESQPSEIMNTIAKQHTIPNAAKAVDRMLGSGDQSQVFELFVKKVQDTMKNIVPSLKIADVWMPAVADPILQIAFNELLVKTHADPTSLNKEFGKPAPFPKAAQSILAALNVAIPSKTKKPKSSFTARINAYFDEVVRQAGEKVTITPEMKPLIQKAVKWLSDGMDDAYGSGATGEALKAKNAHMKDPDSMANDVEGLISVLTGETVLKDQ
jgi:hypothetical protein